MRKIIFLLFLLPLYSQMSREAETQIIVSREHISELERRVNYLELKITSYNLDSRLANIEYAVQQTRDTGERNRSWLFVILSAAVVGLGKQFWSLLRGRNGRNGHKTT